MSQEIIFQGYNQFKERLKPAVLTDTKVNSNIIGAWLVSNGIDINMLQTPEEVADALYRAANATFQQLLWTIEPAKLALMKKEGKAQIQKSAAASENEFAAKLKSAEVAKEHAKTQESALKQINELISTIMFVDGFNSRVDYTKTEKIKAACSVHLDKAIAGGRDLTQAAQEIRDFVSKEYEKAERAKERVL